MKKTFSLALSIISASVISFGGMAYASGGESAVTPDQALANLKEGNARYVSGKSEHPRQDAKRRAETVSGGQHPFAIVLSCADSREPVEILFDQGIGDLFVIRVAGNVADIDELGTMEYGADHLGAPLIVVLGHTKCGAVTAVVKGESVHGNIPQLVDNIVPAAKKVKDKGVSGDSAIPEAIKANVMQAIEDTFKHSEILRGRVAAGKLRIVGGVYDLEKGSVEWLGEHPDQAKLAGAAPAASGGHHHH